MTSAVTPRSPEHQERQTEGHGSHADETPINRENKQCANINTSIPTIVDVSNQSKIKIAQDAQRLANFPDLPFSMQRIYWPNTTDSPAAVDQQTQTPVWYPTGMLPMHGTHYCTQCLIFYTCPLNRGRPCYVAVIDDVPHFWCSDRCQQITLMHYDVLAEATQHGITTQRL